jgi:NAD(P)-dependent dehydrogenase (short-subunit alcohol dehydrogenase family)
VTTVPGSDPHRLALVTGTSSGIGEAVAQELLQRGWRVMGASRRPATITTAGYTHLVLDLAEVGSLASRLDAQAGPLFSDPAASRLALVNNAADVGLLGPVAQLDASAMLRVYAVNAAAPTLLMGWILGQAGPDAAVRIVNVSTGAAVQAYPGLCAYGNTKAALRMAGMVLAAELDHGRASGARQPDATVLSYEPGVVDTPMQAAVRSSPAGTMPIVSTFARFHSEGLLEPPAGPAAEIVDYLDGNGHATFCERRFGVPA